MTHSCVPNCTWAITYSPEFVIKVRPTVPIEKGQVLTVAYNYDYTKYGCRYRQKRILQNAEFNCRCRRCVDVTDLGTFAGGIMCFKCKTGVCLPEEMTVLDSDWKCDKCGYAMCASFAASYAEGLFEQLEMTKELSESDSDEELSEAERLEEFISDNSNIKLHPNHWVLMEAAQRLVNIQSTKLEELTLDQLEGFIFYCEYLLQIRSVISPGASTPRGMYCNFKLRSSTILAVY